MERPIEYTGTPSEWKAAYFGDISNNQNKPITNDLKVGKANKPITMYRLSYRGNVVVMSAPYGVCKSKMNECKKDKNYNSIHLKITKN